MPVRPQIHLCCGSQSLGSTDVFLSALSSVSVDLESKPAMVEGAFILQPPQRIKKTLPDDLQPTVGISVSLRQEEVTQQVHTLQRSFFLFFLLVPKTACRVSPTFFKESFFFFSRTTWVWYFLLYYFTSRPRKEHKEQRSRPTLLLPSHPHFLLSGRRPEAPPQYEKPWTLLLRSTAGPRLTVLLRAKRTVCWKSRYVAKSRRGL